MAQSMRQESRLEKQEGDLLHRRRVVAEMLGGAPPFEYSKMGFTWMYCFLECSLTHRGGVLVVEAKDPEGDRYHIGIPDEMSRREQIEAVQHELDYVALHWTDKL